MNKNFVFIFIVLGLFWGGVQPTNAKNRESCLAPYFFVESGAEHREHFPLKSTSVSAVISGVIADVRVTQIYANLGNRPINARYVFPASAQAAVHGMRMVVGEEIIEARIQERQKARQVFEEARAAGKNASPVR